MQLSPLLSCDLLLPERASITAHAVMSSVGLIMSGMITLAFKFAIHRRLALFTLGKFTLFEHTLLNNN